MNHPIVTIQTSHGSILLELYPEHAPNTVRSFLHLAGQGLFDRREIRRIAPGFVLQPSYSDFDDPRCAFCIEGEYAANGFPNPIPFRRGTVAMGGEGNIASGSCFFITLSDEAGARLDGKFAAFGRVISGMEEVDRIVSVPTRRVVAEDAPQVVIFEPIVPEYMVCVTAETFGESYAPPTIIEA